MIADCPHQFIRTDNYCLMQNFGVIEYDGSFITKFWHENFFGKFKQLAKFYNGKTLANLASSCFHN